jgi:tripartite-type tricarboxylate transporter receptor subunit TctC
VGNRVEEVKMRASRGCFVALGLAMTVAAHAQTYPTKPVRIIVPFPPGGGTDVIGRVLAQRLSGTLGQQFIVENRVGAAGRIGTEAAARATPDGYTLLFTTTSTIITPPALFPKLAYDPLRDFAPVAPIASGAMVLVVHPSIPARQPVRAIRTISSPSSSSARPACG